MISLEVVPSTPSLKSTIDERNPSTIAFRCLATPTPLRYLASALRGEITDMREGGTEGGAFSKQGNKMEKEIKSNAGRDRTNPTQLTLPRPS